MATQESFEKFLAVSESPNLPVVDFLDEFLECYLDASVEVTADVLRSLNCRQDTWPEGTLRIQTTVTSTEWEIDDSSESLGDMLEADSDAFEKWANEDSASDFGELPAPGEAGRPTLDGRPKQLWELEEIDDDDKEALRTEAALLGLSYDQLVDQRNRSLEAAEVEEYYEYEYDEPEPEAVPAPAPLSLSLAPSLPPSLPPASPAAFSVSAKKSSCDSIIADIQKANMKKCQKFVKFYTAQLEKERAARKGAKSSRETNMERILKAAEERLESLKVVSEADAVRRRAAAKALLFD